MLGLSETAAGTRLHRTLTKLRKACNELTTPPRSSATWPPWTPRSRAAPRRTTIRSHASCRSWRWRCAPTRRGPSRAFAEELRERVEAGLPRGEPRARCGRARRKRAERAAARGFLLPVAGVRRAAAAGRRGRVRRRAVRARRRRRRQRQRRGAGGGGSGERRWRRRDGRRGDAAPALPVRPPGEARHRDAAVPAPVRRAASPPGQRNRKIERSFSLELDVPLDEMARVADEVTAVTNRHGGFVLDSSRQLGRRRTAAATSRCASRATGCARLCATSPSWLR